MRWEIVEDKPQITMDAEELRLVMLLGVQPRWIEGTLPDVLRILRFGENWREEIIDLEDLESIEINETTILDEALEKGGGK